MRYQIICNGEIIGHSDLEADDASMAMAWGEFVPSARYPAVRDVFKLKSDATRETSAQQEDQDKLTTYAARRERLQLSLQTAEGQLVSTVQIEISDYSTEEGDGSIEVSAHVDEPGFFEERTRVSEEHWRSRG